MTKWIVILAVVLVLIVLVFIAIKAQKQNNSTDVPPVVPPISSPGRAPIHAPTPAATTTITTTTGTSVTINVKLGKTGTARTASGHTVSITPKEVTQDSRCPEDVNCVWAGTLEVNAEVSGDLGSHQASTYLFNYNPRTKVLTPYGTITLDEVLPVKTFSTPIKDSEYVFTFSVEK